MMNLVILVVAIFSLPNFISSSSIQSSPPVTAVLRSSWAAPSLLIQYFESLSLESPSSLIPFLNHLVSNPTYSTTTPLVSSSATANTNINPILTPYLLPNETFSLLEQQLDASQLLSGRGERDSLRLGLAAREGSVRIEGMRKVWLEREKELVAAVEGEEDCESWIDIAGKRACSVDRFWEMVGDQIEGNPLKWEGSSIPQDIFAFDHLSPFSKSSSLPLVVFYASATSPNFSPLFSLLYSLSSSSSPRLQFALRWRPSSTDIGEKLAMSGFGAGLDIKRIDYLVIDDRLTSGNKDSKSATSEGETKAKMVPVSKEAIADLGIHATSYIMSSANPLKAFTHLTSSFPLLASSLSQRTVDANLSEEVLINQMSSLAASVNSFSINGLSIPLTSVEPFSLLRLLRKERKVVTDIQKVGAGMTTKEAREILSYKEDKTEHDDGRIEVDALGDLFDASDRQEGGDLLLWWNDLEKDGRYRDWSKNIKDILRPTYPGQMSQIAKNTNNVVLVVDLSSPSVLTLLTQNINGFISRGVPIRWGVVPIVGEKNDISTKIAKCLWYLVEASGRGTAMSFLTNLVTVEGLSSEVTLKAAYAKAIDSTTAARINSGLESLVSFEDVQSGGESAVAKAKAYASRLGVPTVSKDSTPLVGAFLFNGAYFPLDADWVTNLQKTMTQHHQFIQQQVYFKFIDQTTDVGNFFYSLPSTYSSRNFYVFPSEDQPLKIVNLVDAFESVDKSFTEQYYTGKTSENDTASTVTMIVVGRFGVAPGRSLLREALLYLDKSPSSRISFLHNPISSSPKSNPSRLSTLLYQIQHSKKMSEIRPVELLKFLDLELDLGSILPKDWSSGNPVLDALVKMKDSDKVAMADYWKSLGSLTDISGLERGSSGIIVNGRVIGPLPADSFSAVDFKGLHDFEMSQRIQSTIDAFNASTFDISSLSLPQQSQIYSMISSVVSEANLIDPVTGMFGVAAPERNLGYRGLRSEYTAIIGENEESAVFEIGIVIDPATELAQKWAPIIETLSHMSSVHLRLHFNPDRQLKDLLIKRFYQYHFQPTLTFDSLSGLETEPRITFEGIPEEVLLTFALDCQRAWLSFPKSCIHDLDNIRLSDLPTSDREIGVSAVFELENLIVEGHVRDMPSAQPPRGLQLQLLSPSSETVGTIVMANFGYFQLQANPGVFQLKIRDGFGSGVFKIQSIGAEGWSSDGVEKTGNKLVVLTLEGLTLYPRVERYPGHELTQLLDDTAAAKAKVTLKVESEGLVDRIKAMWPFLFPTESIESETNALVDTGKRADINIFTVASGLLYERMAFLMIVSVLRNTNSTVKFWFIQNFLSPSFKAFIPHMAREYNFDYELVTYQWPHWLRGQKEKQRTIWGYKILFLDVLFPLELDRVIFVDSDLIVRSDLQALVDLDLEGAPYAYAPMGNDREETKGFRFWDQGYWKEHLRGAPYHISALYVVDLDRFRQIAAGDRLRQHYQALSSDPNSLANLDQDLPNNMFKTLPIYSLDRSWLWCETWCSDESLAQAKAIDLCNNPNTHEPKLSRAKRTIPEWTVYDDEVAALAQRIAATNSGDGGASAFSKKADELEQAKLQSVERDEFEAEESVKAHASEKAEVEVVEEVVGESKVEGVASQAVNTKEVPVHAPVEEKVEEEVRVKDEL